MKTLIANWKANPASTHEAIELFKSELEVASKYPNVGVTICPPTVFLEHISHEFKSLPDNIKLGAQNVYWEGVGAHTGEVTVDMLKNLGVSHVLVGHSEQRKIGETDEMVNKKVLSLLDNGIVPIVLVGEEEKNDAVRSDILIDQMMRGLKDITDEDIGKVKIAYEPVWAISTNEGGKADTPNSALEAIAILQGVVGKIFGEDSIPSSMLYGGSVKSSNVTDFLSKNEISGAVVGGASLDPEEFGEMIRIVSEIK